jgi:serine O-acetyltransferase
MHIMKWISLIRSDIAAKAQWLYGGNSLRDNIKALCTDGTCAMLLYRLMQASQQRHLVPLAMLFNKLNILFGGCIIGRGASFGPRFVLIHSLGVVINSAVRGGAGIHIEHLVTIGAEQGQTPVLGNNIFIGAGAKIIGGITIGDYARIGANAVVIQDVPDHATAVGVPARNLPRADQESTLA